MSIFKDPLVMRNLELTINPKTPVLACVKEVLASLTSSNFISYLKLKSTF